MVAFFCSSLDNTASRAILSLATERTPLQHPRMEIRIREVKPEDLRHILHYRRAMFEEMGFRDEAQLACVDVLSTEYFVEAFEKDTYKGWLAEDGTGQVIGGGGIVIADWPGYPGEHRAKRAWILNMYTEPEARRTGVAKRLLEVMLDWCGMNGFNSVSLHASAAGRPLYEAMGFKQTNEMMLKL